MIKVFEKDAKTLNRRSSKGMQLKWESDHKWYKADSVALLKKHISFHFTKKDVYDILNNDTIYTQEIKERVLNIIYTQMDKYSYLFLPNSK